MKISKEILIAFAILLLFYMLVKKNNILIINPNKDQMENVSYYSDNINDIDFSFKDNE